MKAWKNLKLWIGLAIATVILVPFLVVLTLRLEDTKPEVRLDPSSLAIGVSHELSGSVVDDNSGIRKIWIVLENLLIHNDFDCLPLTYTGIISTPKVTTIDEFSQPKIQSEFMPHKQ